jgi:FixJ family two-component response regulator
LITDVNLPDGKGTELLPLLADRQPATSAIVITADPSMDVAISAMRKGALDFLPKPFTRENLLDRVVAALRRQARDAQKDARLAKLREAFRRLNSARHTVSKKVDLLCNDLINSYSELSRDFEVARVEQDLRTSLTNARDLEQLLANSMDWLVRRFGKCNAAIFLALEDDEYQVAACMNHTLTGTRALFDALREALLPVIQREGFVHFNEDEVGQQLSKEQLKHLGVQTLLGVDCTFAGQSLASIMLFRDADTPFLDTDEQTLRAMGPVLGNALIRFEGDSNTGNDPPLTSDRWGS